MTKSDGTWFSVPHVYWLDGWDRRLSTAEKAMLLISLDQPDRFRMPTDRAPAWYGVSESSAHRGSRTLVRDGVLDRTTEEVIDPKSPTGWKQVHRYTTVGPWSLRDRRNAMIRRRTVKFDTAPENEA